MVDPHPPHPSSDFASVVFYVVEESLAGLASDKKVISDSLLLKGAQSCPPPAEEDEEEEGRSSWRPRFDVDKVTLIVSDTINFPELEDIDRFNNGKGRGDNERKWVVTTRWLERMERSDKWLHPKFFSPDPKLYFSGVCVCVSDEMSAGDRDAIYSAVSAFGGSTKPHLTTEVSHLLCPNTEGAMYKTGIDNAGPGLHVLLPHWVDDCFTKGVRVREDPYAWPDPPILRGDPQKIPSDLTPAQRDLLRHDNYADPSKPAPHPNYETSETLKGKTVVFSSSLEMEKMRLEGIKSMVRRASGEVLEGSEAKMVGRCDILITKHRSGSSYNAAVRGDKTIATVAWLYDVCIAKRWVDPKAHLLHYPLPDDTIPEFAQFNMTVTNYTGDSREYIKKLIDLMGGRFTADMGKKNTHVIAANDQGAKVAKARSWSLTLVNHHWLEACFVRWAVVNPTTDALFSIDSHGLSAQPIIARKGLVDADLIRWTDPARNEEVIEEEDDAMEVEDDLVVVPSGASGRERGYVEMELAEDDEDDDDEMLPETVDIGKKTAKGKEKEKAKIVDKENVEMEDQEDQQQQPKKKRASFASQSKSNPDLSNPSTSSLAGPLPARATSDVFGVLGSSEISLSKAATSPVKGHSSRTITSEKASLSPRRAAPTKEDSREPSSTPKEDEEEEEEQDDDDDEQPPPPPRSKPTSTNAHASTSNAKPSSSKAVPSKPISKKPTSTTSSTTTNINAVASGSGSNSTPRAASTRGVSPSSILPPRSRRKAADNAERLLHETIMPDLLLYEKSKRNGTLMSEPKRRKSGGGDESGSERGGGGRSSSPGKKAKRRKTSAKEDDGEESSADEQEEMGRATKGKSSRARTEEQEERAVPSTARKTGKGKSHAPVKVIARIMSTKITLSDKEIESLAALGGKLVTEPAECTHLVTDQISRTEKFLQALAVVPAVLNKQWVKDSIKAGKLLDTVEPYLLVDPIREKKFNMSLSKVLRRALANKAKGGLLAGKSFWVTKSVETTFDVMKRLVESAGGEISNAIPRASVFTDSPDTKFLISCKKDKNQWKPLADKGVEVYDRELVLTGLVQQQLEFSKFPVEPRK